MNHTLFSSVVMASLVTTLPSLAEAQVCGPAMNCTITRPRPVVSTQMRPQQVTTFCDVTETQVSQRQVIENIPVTTCKNVTVDEGGYQTVWVPKPVTRQVAQTTVRQQVKTVSVPVQVTKRIPQISTQMVPVQTVQYINETVPVQATAMASTCNTCGGGSPMIGSQIFAPQIGYGMQQYQPAPYSQAMVPTMPAITVPSTYQSAAVTIPSSRPTPVAPVPNAYEETVPARNVPAPRDEAIAPARKTSMFTGVPSAASVWQRQSTYQR